MNFKNKEERADILISLADAQSQFQYHFILPLKERTDYTKNALETISTYLKCLQKKKLLTNGQK